MYVLMARLAQSDAVRHIVAEDGVLLPRLDVMRLYSASASTLLAGVIVSFVDGITPLLVLVRITLFVCILLALGIDGCPLCCGMACRTRRKWP